jgi:hypothetical protein
MMMSGAGLDRTRPAALPPKWQAIPQALRDMPAWVAWRYELRGGKWTKPPRKAAGDGYARTDDPATWASFEDAQRAAAWCDGVGLVLTADIVGVDLDHVTDAGGAVEPWAAEVLEHFRGCYVERSPGGDGLRIFCRGVARRSGKGGPGNRCEVYDKASPRYLTVTGHRLGEGDVVEAQAALDWLHATHFEKPAAPRPVAPAPAGASLTDDEVLRLAAKAKNGAKFAALFAGGGGGDDSANDAALIGILSFWTRDAAQLDRLFRRSGLMREKWDSRRGDSTYGQQTIERVLAMGGERFNGTERDPPKPEVQTIAADIVSRYAPQHGKDLRAAQESDQTPPADGADEWDVHHNAQATAPALGDFFAHLPSHSYLYVPTRELWPSSSVNGCGVPWPKVQTPSGVQKVAPSRWLDKHRAVQQMAWHPGEPLLIRDKVLQVSGWAAHPGAAVFNLYRPPQRPQGDASKAGPWLEHVRRVFPDDAAHLIDWLAYKAQHPGDKINHAIVLGGQQGIGKDTLLEPVKAAVGAWNWQDVTPTQMLGRFNGWAKAVIVRINEARDLGDVDRFAFYDHSKALIAAPPDVIRVDEKHLRETYVANVCGVVITTNHLGDGLYLPADDRRHFVAWSALTKDDFDADYWRRMYRWLATGGTGHVCDFLATRDLSGFDPKAPPPKTAAFWAIVAAGEAPESGELRDLIDDMGTPPVLTLSALVDRAQQARQFDLADELKDRKSRRAIPHRLERVGYVPVRNPDADDGLFKIAGKRQAVYAQRRLTVAEQVKAARKFAAQSA